VHLASQAGQGQDANNLVGIGKSCLFLYQNAALTGILASSSRTIANNEDNQNTSSYADSQQNPVDDDWVEPPSYFSSESSDEESTEDVESGGENKSSEMDNKENSRTSEGGTHSTSDNSGRGTSEREDEYSGKNDPRNTDGKQSSREIPDLFRTTATPHERGQETIDGEPNNENPRIKTRSEQSADTSLDTSTLSKPNLVTVHATQPLHPTRPLQQGLTYEFVDRDAVPLRANRFTKGDGEQEAGTGMGSVSSSPNNNIGKTIEQSAGTGKMSNKAPTSYTGARKTIEEEGKSNDENKTKSTEEKEANDHDRLSRMTVEQPSAQRMGSGVPNILGRASPSSDGEEAAHSLALAAAKQTASRRLGWKFKSLLSSSVHPLEEEDPNDENRPINPKESFSGRLGKVARKSLGSLRIRSKTNEGVLTFEEDVEDENVRMTPRPTLMRRLADGFANRMNRRAEKHGHTSR
jgi:hypothetical protein